MTRTENDYYIPFDLLVKRKGIEKSHDAFILISPGTYFFAAIFSSKFAISF